MAPMYYGLLRASASANQRSVANGLVVSATEQMRTYPYYEIGYYTTPSGCATSSPVILGSTINDPLASLPMSKTIGNVTYTIQRCVNWANSTVTGDTLAYKQSVVTVSWVSKVTEWIEPLGEARPLLSTPGERAPTAVRRTTISPVRRPRRFLSTLRHRPRM